MMDKRTQWLYVSCTFLCFGAGIALLSGLVNKGVGRGVWSGMTPGEWGVLFIVMGVVLVAIVGVWSLQGNNMDRLKHSTKSGRPRAEDAPPKRKSLRRRRSRGR